MRRIQFPILLIVAALLLGASPVKALAQDATPPASDATFSGTLGLPELRITATDSGFEGVPSETAAGRYLVTLTNNSSTDAILEFMQLPAEVTVDAFRALARQQGANQAPDWYYRTYMAGGPSAQFPGQTVQGIVDLTPGSYVVWGGEPTAPGTPVALTVSGGAEAAVAPAAPTADVTVREVATADGYAFELDGEFAPGPQVVKTVNESDQPHYWVLTRSPQPITVDQVLAMLTLPEGATPPPGVPNPAALIDVTDAFGVGTQSTGTTQWLATNLEPGYYIITCFIPDPTKDHLPHVFEGMIDVIAVGDVDAPAP